MCVGWPPEAWWSTHQSDLQLRDPQALQWLLIAIMAKLYLAFFLSFFHGEQFIGNEPQEVSATDYNENAETS